MKPKHFDAFVSLALVVVDMVMATTGFTLAYYMRLWIDFPTPTNPNDLITFGDYLPLLLMQVVLVIITFFFYQLYHLTRASSRVDQVYTILNAVSIAILFSIALTTLFQDTAFEVSLSRTIILYGWVLTILLTSLGRWLHQQVRQQLQQRGIGQDRLLVVGTGDIATVVVQKIKWSPYLGYNLIGLVSHSDDSPQEELLGYPIIGGTDNLQQLIAEYEIDEIIIALADVPHADILSIIASCQRGKISIQVVPDVFEIMAGEVSVDALGGLPLLTVRDVALRGWRQMLKRTVDIIGSIVGLVSLSPLMILIAAAIKAESPGDVLFVQERVGLDGRPFQMYKFRSMRTDAELQSRWTVKDDPRRTRLGKFIRKMSIDELPQFINVLLGDMSLVGPRPEQPKFVEEFERSIPRYTERHREKAGLTGWAQINGLRGDTSIEERTKYDLWYIEHWSLWLDIKIMLRTIYRIFADRNAY